MDIRRTNARATAERTNVRWMNARACDDCFHRDACHMWSNGAISHTVALKCQQYEPVSFMLLKELRDLKKMHKGDLAPVVHAMWVRQDDTYTRFQCGACKAKNFDRRWDFCPLCGAKMDGGKNNG